MIAPLRDIEPLTLLFSKLTLSFWTIASSRDIFTKFSFCSKLGASEFFSILSFLDKFSDLGTGSGAKNREYKTITAADKEIAATTFFVSIIF